MAKSKFLQTLGMPQPAAKADVVDLSDSVIEEAVAPIKTFILQNKGARSSAVRSYRYMCEGIVATLYACRNKKNLSNAVVIGKQAKKLSTLSPAALENVVKELFFQDSLIESIVDHTGFISGLEKATGAKVDHWEPVREGVYVYLDGENTEKLSAAISVGNSYFQDIVDKLGYILLKKGTIDSYWGEYGNNYSKWLFVYAPPTDEKELETSDKALTKNLKQVDL